MTMEKKQYIEPLMIVRGVNMKASILAASPGGYDEIGNGVELSKGIDLSEDNGNEGVTTHDVWED